MNTDQKKTRSIEEMAGTFGIPALCEYCEQVKPQGYLATYKAYVCEDCYEDHHGRGL